MSEFGAEENRIRAAYARRESRASQHWLDPGYVFILQGVERHVLTVLRRSGGSALRGKRILEVGCGTGHWLREFNKWGARAQDLVGLDLLPGRLKDARQQCPAGVKLFCGSAGALALPDASFDLVYQFDVFTSILDAGLKHRVAFEMLRVLKPGGLILWYDFFLDNPRNPDVRGVGKREILSLFPGCSVKLRRVTLAPPITRRLAFRSWLACSLLEAMPLLRTHFLGVIRRAELHPG